MKIFALVFCISLLSPLSFANTTTWGCNVAVGNGVVRAYVESDDNKNPVSLGIAVTGNALNGLPTVQHQYDFLLPMPDSSLPAPFQHIMINWNPHGHDPVEIYGAPHFDFHFYTITNEVRSKITCAGDDQAICMKQPDPSFLPPYYAATPAGVPGMGWHWFDTRSPEFHGQPFTSTLIYGFYNGQVAFVEPMITRDFLLSHGTVDADIPLPMKVAQSGYYPTRYTMTYDSVQDVTFVALKQFSKLEM